MLVQPKMQVSILVAQSKSGDSRYLQWMAEEVAREVHVDGIVEIRLSHQYVSLHPLADYSVQELAALITRCVAATLRRHSYVAVYPVLIAPNGELDITIPTSYDLTSEDTMGISVECRQPDLSRITVMVGPYQSLIRGHSVRLQGSNAD